MYTTTANIEGALQRKLTDTEASYFSTVLSPAIEAYIDRETGTSFASDDEVEVYVSGSGSSRLVIPTMWQVTEVKRGNNAINPTHYQTFPATAPYLAITHKSGRWQQGIDNYIVTGKLGFEAVPADITAIATELASNHFSTVREDGAVIKSERTGDNSVTYADMSSSMSISSTATLDGYKRLSRSL